MDLYYSPSSGNSSRAVFALCESGAPWQPRRLDARAGETRRPEYLALNPMGKIPTLVDGQTVLWESNAINWYVAETHPGAGLLPAAPAGRAAVQRWMFFQAGHVTPAAMPVYRLINPRVRAFWGGAGDEQAAAAGRVELARYLPVLEAALDGRDWLEGAFSLADIAYAPHLWLLDEGGFDFTPHDHVRGWLDRLLARPGWRQARQLVFG